MEQQSNNEKLGMPPAYEAGNSGASSSYGAPAGYIPQPGYPAPQIGYPPQQQQTVINTYNTGGAHPPPMQPTQQVTYVTQQNSGFSSMRAAIPVMPMCIAITLCVINCILPGIGTIIASFTVFCCSNDTQSGNKFGLFCLNFWVGWLQLLTLFVFFIGWVWAIMWGVAFITLAAAPAQTITTTTTTTTVPVPAYTVQQQTQQQQMY